MGRQKQTRLPITPEFALDEDGMGVDAMPKGCVNAMGSLMSLVFGFLRMGEAVVPLDTEFNLMVHLTYQDVQAESTSQPKWIRVRLKASKTDPFGVCATIYVGTTGKWLYPVVVVLAYMVQQVNGGGPLFQFSNWRYLTRSQFISALRTALQEAGIDATQFASHCFRIGAATKAFLCGIQD